MPCSPCARPTGVLRCLVSNSNPMSSGAANLRYVEFTDRGTLWIALHRGEFADGSVAARHAPHLATVIDDIVADALGSFHLPDLPFDGALAGPVGTIEIVRPHGDRSFAELLRDRRADPPRAFAGVRRTTVTAGERVMTTYSAESTAQVTTGSRRKS